MVNLSNPFDDPCPYSYRTPLARAPGKGWGGGGPMSAFPTFASLCTDLTSSLSSPHTPDFHSFPFPLLYLFPLPTVKISVLSPSFSFSPLLPHHLLKPTGCSFHIPPNLSCMLCRKWFLCRRLKLYLRWCKGVWPIESSEVLFIVSDSVYCVNCHILYSTFVQTRTMNISLNGCTRYSLLCENRE